jgi:hypothetical protein
MTTMDGWTVYSSTSQERHIDYLMMAIAEVTAIAILNPLFLNPLTPSSQYQHRTDMVRIHVCSGSVHPI